MVINAGKSSLGDQLSPDSEQNRTPLEEPEVERDSKLTKPEVKINSRLRKWLTLGSLTSLVALTGIISTTKDGFDLARDYIIPEQAEEPPIRAPQETDSQLTDSKRVSAANINLERPESLPYERSVQELIDLLEHRAAPISLEIKDDGVRQEFLSLHAKNIVALRQGKLVLAYEITQEIHSLLSLHLGHASLLPGSEGTYARRGVGGGGGGGARVGGGGRGRPSGSIRHEKELSGHRLAPTLRVWYLYPSPPIPEGSILGKEAEQYGK